MNVEDSSAEIRRIGGLSEAAAEMSNNATIKYQAHMQLYNVAVNTGDKDEQNKQRDILHNLLDQLLDATYEVGTNARLIRQIMASVTN